MITQEQNEQLARVGPGTPMGNLLRRYWQPVGAAAELARAPVQRVRLLGEDLVLFRTPAGAYGLVGSRCAHRGLSLALGVPQENGLRCAYHGWTYNTAGRVVDMPFEPACMQLKIAGYPVQELGGLLFAYLGPAPAPLLPRYDLFVRDDLDKAIQIVALPCNWLQCMENSLDPVHVEHLHGYYGNYVLSQQGKTPKVIPPRHERIAFDVFAYGIIKRRLLEGESEDCDEWQIGHPVLFPNTLSVGDERRPLFQIRVPVDDTHTLQYRYQGVRRAPEAPPQDEVPVTREELFDAQGQFIGPPDAVPPQDMLAWVEQGALVDRTQEHLATSDKGILLYRKLLLDSLAAVKRGEDPFGILRDPAQNEPMIVLPRERRDYPGFYTPEGEYGGLGRIARPESPAPAGR